MRKSILFLAIIGLLTSCCLSQVPTQYLFLDENCEAYLPDYKDEIVVRDNCGVVSIVQTPPPFTLVTTNTQVTLTAVDNSGNTTSERFMVIVLDTIPPVIGYPPIDPPPIDPPPADSTLRVVNTINVDNMPLGRELSEADLHTINPTTWYLGGELDDVCETVGIVDYGEHNWMRNYHEENTCCVESNVDIPSNGGGGLLWTIWGDQERNQYRKGFIKYKAKWPMSYNHVGDGCKMPGVRTEEDYPFEMTLAPMPDAGASIRTMSKHNVLDSVDIQWYAYPHLYADYRYGRTHTPENSTLPPGIIDRVAMGVEYELMIKYFAGDTGVRNGWLEWWRDGVLIDRWEGLNFTERSDIVFDVITYATFPGGASQSYYASGNTYWDTGEFEFGEIVN